MSVRMVTGMVLIHAPASALNNAGLERGRLAENKVVVKKIRKGRDEFPYVSGQAVKRWWRETIQAKFGWETSPVIREESIAYTAANPIRFEEDDVFGYMLAPKERLEDIGMVAGLAYRRIAPLKCTPLISVFPNMLTDDFGVFARGSEAMAEPVIYEQEFYSTILKGAFSLMLSEVGIFTRGRAMDLPRPTDAEEALRKKTKEDREKSKPQVEKFQQRVAMLEQDAKAKSAQVGDSQIILPLEERKRRIKQTLLALPELSGGAKRSDYLTDVAPRLVIATILDCANHIFLDVTKAADSKVTLNTDAVEEIVRDYHQHLLSGIYLGVRKGFLDDAEYERLQSWASNGIKVSQDKNVSVIFGTPKEAITKLANKIDELNL